MINFTWRNHIKDYNLEVVGTNNQRNILQSHILATDVMDAKKYNTTATLK